jgi:hypothetical protein
LKKQPQRKYRELEVCDECRRVDSFTPYAWKGNIIYAKCECGAFAVIQLITKLRGIDRKCR